MFLRRRRRRDAPCCARNRTGPRAPIRHGTGAFNPPQPPLPLPLLWPSASSNQTEGSADDDDRAVGCHMACPSHPPCGPRRRPARPRPQPAPSRRENHWPGQTWACDGACTEARGTVAGSWPSRGEAPLPLRGPGGPRRSPRHPSQERERSRHGGLRLLGERVATECWHPRGASSRQLFHARRSLHHRADAGLRRTTSGRAG